MQGRNSPNVSLYRRFLNRLHRAIVEDTEELRIPLKGIVDYPYELHARTYSFFILTILKLHSNKSLFILLLIIRMMKQLRIPITCRTMPRILEYLIIPAKHICSACSEHLSSLHFRQTHRFCVCLEAAIPVNSSSCNDKSSSKRITSAFAQNTWVGDYFIETHLFYFCWEHLSSLYFHSKFKSCCF